MRELILNLEFWMFGTESPLADRERPATIVDPKQFA
jgi:hypothetical protein